MNQRVLVCEDDRAIRLLLGRVLTRRSLLVECVETGADAVARLRQRPYDLILLDLAMPVLSGYEVVNVIQREQPTFSTASSSSPQSSAHSARDFRSRRSSANPSISRSSIPPSSRSFHGRPWVVATTNQRMPKESSGDGLDYEQVPRSHRGG